MGEKMAKRARRKAADESLEDEDKEVPIKGRDIETMGKLQRLATAVAEVAKSGGILIWRYHRGRCRIRITTAASGSSRWVARRTVGSCSI